MQKIINIKVKPYTIKELSAIYGVSVHVINKWLSNYHDEIGEKKALVYTVKQVEIIFEKLGIPYSIAA